MSALTDIPLRNTRVPNASVERLHVIDLARGGALLCMIVFHVVRDLEVFALVPAGTTLSGGWAIFARAIAGSFLFLSGVSLVLAHRHGFRASAWLRRLTIITGAALLVTLATYAVFPSRFVYFGILHAIAACSIFGVPALFAPAWATGLAAAAILSVSLTVGRSLFETPWLAWTGLSQAVPPALDYIPLFPWFAVFLAGITIAKTARLPELALSTGLARSLVWSGQNSLVIYLTHQPVLIAIVWAIAQIG